MLESLTSTPAKALRFGHHAGLLRGGYDANVEVVFASPSACGTPAQVYRCRLGKAVVVTRSFDTPALKTTAFDVGVGTRNARFCKLKVNQSGAPARSEMAGWTSFSEHAGLWMQEFPRLRSVFKMGVRPTSTAVRLRLGSLIDAQQWSFVDNFSVFVQYSDSAGAASPSVLR